tara:strand:- start:1895 stop:2146 length:252 start_codon:yes stop_codon:yes gene_type:complete
MEKTYNYKFKIEIDKTLEGLFSEEDDKDLVKRFRYTKEITEKYGIPRPSIYKIISGKMDERYGKWRGMKITHIDEAAFIKREF